MNQQQRDAARMVAQGIGSGEIARRLGVSAKTISRWKKLPDFLPAVASETDPSIRATLEAALHANKRDGSPDHAIRIAAAKALISLGENVRSEQATVVNIYKREAA